MNAAASPPPEPPRLSPDGKWVWDGGRWLPIGSVPEPAPHKSVFPAWNARIEAAKASTPVAQVAPLAPVAQAAQVAQSVPGQFPGPPAASYPASYPAAYAGSYSASVPADEPSLPLWRQPVKSALTKYLYGGAGAVALLIVAVYLNSLGPIVWPWSATSTPRPTATKTLAPLSMRSDYARADSYVKGLLLPAFLDLSRSAPIVDEVCSGGLTEGCQSAVTVTDNQLKDLLSGIDREAVPSCIATSVARIRLDIAAMDGGLQFVLQGFKDGQSSEVVQGLSRYAVAAQPLQTDAGAVLRAQKLQCDTQLVGP